MRARGHQPTTKDNAIAKGDTSKRVTISCKHCNLTADVICKLQPNEIQIGGEAVALNCNVATIGIPEKEFGLDAVEEKMAMYAVMGC